MKELTIEELKGLIRLTLPYSKKISIEDSDRKDDVYFTWMGTRYKVQRKSLLVEEVENGMLISTNATILMRIIFENELNLKAGQT